MIKSDYPYTSRFVSSPNREPRLIDTVDILLLHYTGMVDAASAEARLCDPAAKVSSHYIVDESGDIVQLVQESERAWHAGVSCWDGETDINSRSIGIEIVNGGHDFDLPEFPDRQIDAVIKLCSDIQSRWRIPQSRVLAHSDVAPSRKSDPGEKFPWQTLHEAGVGLWMPFRHVESSDSLRMGDCSLLVAEVKKSLREYGYHVAISASFDAAMRDVVIAFQRHFRPERIDGVIDASLLATLQQLLAMKRMEAS